MSRRLPKSKSISLFRQLSCKPLSREAWVDFVELFGDRGACDGCWCMYWRLRRSEYEKMKGDGNRKEMRRLVERNETPGLLLYVDGKVVGWCSVAPRENFTALKHSKILKPVDDRPVWSIVCFFIAKEFRRLGLTHPFLMFVTDYCRSQGVKIIEGYPVDVASKDYPVVFAHVGFYSAFIKAGFTEVARNSPTRPIMRKYL
ncbi:MAG: GNAT family N-acetyltransferase [Bacteroidetes bacterium]|nr:GNAT family N-acetyltransferase [Bacteroidota bacterium]